MNLQKIELKNISFNFGHMVTWHLGLSHTAVELYLGFKTYVAPRLGFNLGHMAPKVGLGLSHMLLT